MNGGLKMITQIYLMTFSPNLMHYTKIFYTKVRITQPWCTSARNLQDFNQVVKSHDYTLVFRFQSIGIRKYLCKIFDHIMAAPAWAFDELQLNLSDFTSCLRSSIQVMLRSDFTQYYTMFDFNNLPKLHTTNNEVKIMFRIS